MARPKNNEEEDEGYEVDDEEEEEQPVEEVKKPKPKVKPIPPHRHMEVEELKERVDKIDKDIEKVLVNVLMRIKTLEENFKKFVEAEQ